MTLDPGDVVLAYWSAALDPRIVGRSGDWMMTAWRKAAGTHHAEMRYRYYESLDFDGNDEKSRYGFRGAEGLTDAAFLEKLQGAVDVMTSRPGFHGMHRVDVNGDAGALQAALLADKHLVVQVTRLEKGPT